MDSIFAMDVEALFSTYGEKYTHEIELLTQTIEICMVEGSIHNDQNKEMLISSLERRIIINCTIEKYQNVLDDFEILKEFAIKLEKETLLAWLEASLALNLKTYLTKLEEGQNKYGHNFKSKIRELKSFSIKEWIKQNVIDDETKIE